MLAGQVQELSSGNPGHRLLCHSFAPNSNRIAAAGEVITTEALATFTTMNAQTASVPKREGTKPNATRACPHKAAVHGSPESDATVALDNLAMSDSVSRDDDMFCDNLATLSLDSQKVRRRGRTNQGAAPAVELLVGRCPIDVWNLQQ